MGQITPSLRKSSISNFLDSFDGYFARHIAELRISNLIYMFPDDQPNFVKATLDAENQIRVRALPAYTLTWRQNSQPDGYPGRKFASGAIHFTFLLPWQLDDTTTRDRCYHLERIITDMLSNPRYYRQTLRIQRVRLLSGNPTFWQLDPQVISFRLDYELVLF
jgi:hypothetical protein